ncbi:MAG: hypothetical protein JOZ04_11130 [Acidimicrobiia bacterium]|nr:hypothetical protein [Acidimicrobiia bacterium]
MQLDVHNPRRRQAVAAGVILLAFVADFRIIVLVVALGLLATFVRVEREHRITWATEAGLLVLSALLFLVGRTGWAWVLASVAAGIAALAAAADVWILPDRG